MLYMVCNSQPKNWAIALRKKMDDDNGAPCTKRSGVDRDLYVVCTSLALNTPDVGEGL